MKQDMDWDDYVGQRLSLRQAIAIGTGLGLVAAVLALAFVAFVVGAFVARKAHAQERYCASVGHRWACSREWPHTDCGWRRYCRRHAYQGEGYREGIRYYNAPRDDERWERDERERCLDRKRVVGSEHASVEGALNAAKRQWMSLVRWDHGEKFMNIDIAKDYRQRCERSSTNETIAGRAAEGLTGSFYTRCEVIAAPCVARRVNTEEDKR